jgi:hypothetical protein
MSGVGSNNDGASESHWRSLLFNRSHPLNSAFGCRVARPNTMLKGVDQNHEA